MTKPTKYYRLWIAPNKDDTFTCVLFGQSLPCQQWQHSLTLLGIRIPYQKIFLKISWHIFVPDMSCKNWMQYLSFILVSLVSLCIHYSISQILCRYSDATTSFKCLPASRSCPHVNKTSFKSSEFVYDKSWLQLKSYLHDWLFGGYPRAVPIAPAGLESNTIPVKYKCIKIIL